MNRDVDVVVVGSGAAGLCAALSARAAGAERVLVAEAEAVVGGSSRLSGGLIMGAGTWLQQVHGIVDRAEDLLHDYLAVNRWDVDVEVVRAFCRESGPTVDWLADLGVEFHDELVKAKDERTARVHVPVGNGQAVIDVLHSACRERDIDIALGRRVDRLLTEDGAVIGVAVGPDEIRAHAVVVASGGFGNSPEKLAAHFPSAAATGWTWYIGGDGARGDAIDLAEQVGAQLIGHDHGLRLLHGGFDRVYEAFLPGWLVLVDRDGRRFVDETAPYGVLDHLLHRHGDAAFVVFDDAALERSATWGPTQFAYPVPGHVRPQSKHWNPDLVEQMVASGHVVTAGSPAELASALGIDPDVFLGTVERYNAAAVAGHDDQFGKEPRFLQPIGTPPFYAAELRPATVCSTAFGLRVTPTAEVLDARQRPIPGLYAAGECTGAVVGPSYFGSGNNYANACGVGRIAGRSAASRASR